MIFASVPRQGSAEIQPIEIEVTLRRPPSSGSSDGSESTLRHNRRRPVVQMVARDAGHNDASPEGRFAVLRRWCRTRAPSVSHRE